MVCRPSAQRGRWRVDTMWPQGLIQPRCVIEAAEVRRAACNNDRTELQTLGPVKRS